MTGALVVKGFNEISYDELMDVNGGFTITGVGHYNKITDWGVAVIATWGDTGYFIAGVDTKAGMFLRYHADNPTYYTSSSSN